MAAIIVPFCPCDQALAHIEPYGGRGRPAGCTRSAMPKGFDRDGFPDYAIAYRRANRAASEMPATQLGHEMTHALRQAIALHQQGRLVDAERLYRQALRSKGQDFHALHMLA